MSETSIEPEGQQGMQSQKELISTAAVISPTYWGSLFGLLIGLAGAVTDSAVRKVPSHVVALSSDLGIYVFWGAVLVVGLLTTRYYIASCVNVYGGSTTSVLLWPKKLRSVAFGLLTLLVLLSVIAVGLVAAIGVVWALVICLLMTFLSFIACVATFALQFISREKYGTIDALFGLGDLFLLLLLFWLYTSVVSGPSDATIIGMVFIVGFLFLLFITELQRSYWEDLRQQWKLVRHHLED